MTDALLNIGWLHYGIVSAAIFGAGLATVLIRKNAIAMLLGIELIINAAAINFVAAAFYLPKTADTSQTSAGTVFAVFVIVTAAAEAAVALAIIMNFYNSANSIDLSRADQLSG